MNGLVLIPTQREGLPERRPSNVSAVAYLKIRGDATALVLLLQQSIDITSLSKIANWINTTTKLLTKGIIA
jgi:hypothetical protein